MDGLHRLQIEPIIKRALEEDWGYRDWTTDLCVPSEKLSRAEIICKEDILLSGVEVAALVFELVDPQLKIEVHAENGQRLSDRSLIMAIEGAGKSILKAERVALNMMGRMCGIAMLTARYVDAIQGEKTRLLDTRKTTPGLRILDKAATATGGARNHRFGLSDGVMVKENHIRAAGGITNAVSSLMESLPPTIKIEVETTCLDEVKEAVEAGADIIMLDNMSTDEMRNAVELVAGRALLEASGNVRLDTIGSVSATGVDFVSTSSIITRAEWADLSLLFDV